jgi:predicted DNA-binding WGR domain protein
VTGSDASEDTGGPRRFHHTDGVSSHKFWDIRVQGARQTVRFGRIGTAGQERHKCFATDAEARQASEKLVAEKLRKGYREVSPAEADADAGAPPLTRRRLPKEPPGGAAAGQLLLPL